MVKVKQKLKITLIIACAVFAILCASLAWITARRLTTVQCTAFSNAHVENYTEQEKVFSAMSLSYLVYGLEGLTDAKETSDTVENILATQKLGIVVENADVTRLDEKDPSSAMIDTGAFITQTVGGFRFLTDLKDEKSSFYGAVLADDVNKTVWITYSGSVSFKDFMQASLLVIGAGLSAQEKLAFTLYESALATPEISSGYDLILTGHSLGGALATMVAYKSGAEAVTVSGADGLAVKKIKSFKGSAPDTCKITNYLTSPKGCGFSVKNTIQRMMFWADCDEVTSHVYGSNGMTDDVHCVFGFVQFADSDLTKPVLPQEISK